MLKLSEDFVYVLERIPYPTLAKAINDKIDYMDDPIYNINKDPCFSEYNDVWIGTVSDKKGNFVQFEVKVDEKALHLTKLNYST